jgi:hypothetical protein
LRISQRFNATGVVGVVLLVLGPTVAAVSYAWLVDSMAYEMAKAIAAGRTYNSSEYFFGIAIGGAMTLLAFPLVVVGREFETQASSEFADRSYPSRDPSL